MAICPEKHKTINHKTCRSCPFGQEQRFKKQDCPHQQNAAIADQQPLPQQYGRPVADNSRSARHLTGLGPDYPGSITEIKRR